MAKKFLYFIAFCIVIFLVGRIGYELFQDELAEIALVPSTEFTPTEPMEVNAYQDPDLWYSRPGIGVEDPARWQPAYAAMSKPQMDAFAIEAARAAEPTGDDDAVSLPDFAVFFVHPTSYLSRDNWNAPLGDAEAERIARIYVRGMASPFNKASEIWAPRYRQATMGAFLTDEPEGQQAIDAAYADVLEAYRFFVSSLDADTPVVLAGHSQGSLHLLRLLREEVKNSPIADRLVAAYVIGWPISVDHDLPALGFPACATPAQTGCVISWSSFAEPADPSRVIETYANSTGYDGEKRGESTILCTNPLTGKFGGAAPESANLGTLVPENGMETGELVPGAVPARCDERGLLLIGDPPEMGSYVLPGNNYHVYDIPLFWANTQADVARRVRAMDPAN
ncbi:DUF3089 domain-containing protein [Erythrobacter sp. THAF29]|uniref:DUF3089 domain-containing protein n=1 Tax=Erythrobacter sp. THAF29 TaxID=2587851 RepID=UPI001267DC48|nr:DUF3089 domain-containing protein [Erythrobacter sp. THAF29]QFT77250.1 hypothetical protein FIU90_06820 [Erythrobacter sp. THAF29]